MQNYTPCGRPLRNCVNLPTISQKTTSAHSKNLLKVPIVGNPSVASKASEESDTSTFPKGEKHVELPYRDPQAKMRMALGQHAEPGPLAPLQLGTTSLSISSLAPIALPKQSKETRVANFRTARAVVVPASAGYANSPPPRKEPPASIPVLAEYKGDEDEALRSGFRPASEGGEKEIARLQVHRRPA